MNNNKNKLSPVSIDDEKNSKEINKVDDVENDLVYEKEDLKDNNIDTNINYHTSSDIENELNYDDSEFFKINDKNILIIDDYKNNNEINMDDIIVTDYEINNLKDNDEENNNFQNINYYDNEIDYDTYMYLNIRKFQNNYLMENINYKIRLDNIIQFSNIEYKETNDCINKRYDYIIIHINNMVGLHIQYKYFYKTIINFVVGLYFDKIVNEYLNEDDYKNTVHIFLKKYSHYYQYNCINIIKDKHKWWKFWKCCF
jgi:hypothetical protein